MFSRFRKEGRSELLEEQAHDSMSVPEEDRKRLDPGNAGTTVDGPSAKTGPEVSEPEDAGHVRLPAQADGIRSEQPAADLAAEAPAMDAGDSQNAAAAAVVNTLVDEAALPAPIKRPRLTAPRRRQGKRLAAPGARAKPATFTAEQRLLLLDTWRRSAPAGKGFCRPGRHLDAHALQLEETL